MPGAIIRMLPGLYTIWRRRTKNQARKPKRPAIASARTPCSAASTQANEQSRLAPGARLLRAGNCSCPGGRPLRHLAEGRSSGVPLALPDADTNAEREDPADRYRLPDTSEG